jgi:ATP-dependent RNA helicase DHX8/PRP22
MSLPDTGRSTIDIRVRADRPAFIEQARKALAVDLTSPVVIKAPDGSLNQAALYGVARARERHQQGSATAVPAWKLALSEETHWQTLGESTELSLEEQRAQLAIVGHRAKLVAAVQEHPVVIVVSPHGTGKTTQIAQYLAHADLGRVAVTQAGRSAAIAAAARVAAEMGCAVGADVGYRVRLEDRTSPATRIVYITDGLLVRECAADPALRAYDTVVLDDADERAIMTDVLLAALRAAGARRPELRLVVTCSMMDFQRLVEYFGNCPVLYVPAHPHTHSVDIVHAEAPEVDYLHAALKTVLRIQSTTSGGDILLFLPTVEDIDAMCSLLYTHTQSQAPDAPDLLVLPVYSALPSATPRRVLAPAPAPASTRKVVVTTHAPGTRLAIPGIAYVVDSGLAAHRVFDAHSRQDAPAVLPISRAEALARAQRAGTACFRLYTARAHDEEMHAQPVPDVRRLSLRTTALALRVLGLGFADLPDAPPAHTAAHALDALWALGGLDAAGAATPLARAMLALPVERRLVRALLASGCAARVLLLLALLPGQRCAPSRRRPGRSVGRVRRVGAGWALGRGRCSGTEFPACGGSARPAGGDHAPARPRRHTIPTRRRRPRPPCALRWAPPDRRSPRCSRQQVHDARRRCGGAHTSVIHAGSRACVDHL